MNNSQGNIEKEFNVIGISIRTSNREAMEHGSIQKHWHKFMSDAVLENIPNKIDDAIIAVYSDYESDKNGEYNLLLGTRVSSVDQIPAGMIARNVPSEKRITFESEIGTGDSLVFDLWKKIWMLEDTGKLIRAYSTDYELYDSRSFNPETAQMEIHISSL